MALLPGVQVLRDGRVVVGGSPWRALVLSAERASQVRDLMDGHAPDPELLDVLVRHGLATPSPPVAEHGDLPPLDGVTLVVPVHNDAPRLGTALGSVPPGVRLVVVDDGSSDGSAAVAEALGATVVRHEVARGPAAARNAGLAAVTTTWVAFLDSDVSADPSWLVSLLLHLTREDVALVGPRIAALNLDDPSPLARYEAAVSPLDRGPDAAVVAPRATVDYLPSAALVGRTSALREVGGFDETLQLGEDVDLCHRLHAAGWQVRYDPTAEVRHDHRTTWTAWLRRRRAYSSAGPAVAARHGGAQPPVPAGGGLGTMWLLLGPGRLRVRLAVAAAVAGAAAARTALDARAAGVPTRVAVEGAVRREAAGAQRVVGMLPRQSALPLALVWALVSPRGRVVVPVAIVLQHLKLWRELRPSVSPYTFVALRAADEGALAVGLWTACWKARTVRPLLVRFGGPAAVRREDDD